MLTRREWMGSGAFGVLGGGEQAPAALNRESVDRIVQALQTTADQAVAANSGCTTGVCQAASKIRDACTLFFRANQKFPDSVDVGIAVFYEMYDWHIRNQQPLNVTRSADGRYALGYMFTRLVLRPDVVPEFIGVAYDLRA